MRITDEIIRYTAALAKLDLTEEEAVRAKEDLSNIIDYIDHMNELDTCDIKPMSHISKVTNVFREDIVKNKPDRENLLKNAPRQKDGYFMVPKTIE